MHFKKLLFTCAALLATNAHAATIIGYDITDASPSGVEGVTYNYDGTITESTNPDFPGGVDLLGGSGSLNDGIIPDSLDGNQIFAAGAAVGIAEITLYFDQAIRIQTIDFLSSAVAGLGDAVAGRLSSLTAESDLEGAFETVTAESFGANSTSGRGVNARFDFSDSVPFSTTSVQSVTLSQFLTQDQFPFSSFSIGEIVVTEAPVAPVPLPASGLLMVAGIGGLITARRRKKAS